MMEKVVVLGGGFLGVNAALELSSSNVEVVLVDDDLVHEYIPGTIDLIRNRVDGDKLVVELDDFFPEGVEVVDSVVEGVDRDEKVVETSDGLIGYDKLVVGLGGEPNSYGVDISEAEHVWGVEASNQLVENLGDADSAVVVGGGYVGVEVAGELADKGLDVTVVDGSTRPLNYLDEKSSEKILEVFNNKGIKFKGGKRASKIDSNGIVTDEGKDLVSDVVVWAGGVQANSTVQKAFSTDFKGVKVNHGLSMVDDENVFVGGDCADLTGQKTAHKAMNQSKVIAKNILSDGDELTRMEEDQSFLVVSIGSTAGLVYKDKVLAVSRFLRYFKDLIRVYYLWNLKIKKRFNAGFLP